LKTTKILLEEDIKLDELDLMLSSFVINFQRVCGQCLSSDDISSLLDSLGSVCELVAVW